MAIYKKAYRPLRQRCTLVSCHALHRQLHLSAESTRSSFPDALLGINQERAASRSNDVLHDAISKHSIRPGLISRTLALLSLAPPFSHQCHRQNYLHLGIVMRCRSVLWPMETAWIHDNMRRCTLASSSAPGMQIRSRCMRSRRGSMESPATCVRHSSRRPSAHSSAACSKEISCDESPDQRRLNSQLFEEIESDHQRHGLLPRRTRRKQPLWAAGALLYAGPHSRRSDPVRRFSSAISRSTVKCWGIEQRPSIPGHPR